MLATVLDLRATASLLANWRVSPTKYLVLPVAPAIPQPLEGQLESLTATMMCLTLKLMSAIMSTAFMLSSPGV